jgi:hypothetical protein
VRNSMSGLKMNMAAVQTRTINNYEPGGMQMDYHHSKPENSAKYRIYGHMCFKQKWILHKSIWFRPISVIFWSISWILWVLSSFDIFHSHEVRSSSEYENETKLLKYCETYRPCFKMFEFFWSAPHS